MAQDAIAIYHISLYGIHIHRQFQSSGHPRPRTLPCYKPPAPPHPTPAPCPHPQGFFKGTSATLSRELPFYVFGMIIYEQLKKVGRGNLWGQDRQLGRAEILGLGALSGAISAVLTTPADVIKSRIMTSAVGVQVSFLAVAVEIVRVSV